MTGAGRARATGRRARRSESFMLKNGRRTMLIERRLMSAAVDGLSAAVLVA